MIISYINNYKLQYVVNAEIARFLGYTKIKSIGLISEVWEKPIDWLDTYPYDRSGIPDFCKYKEMILKALTYLNYNQKKFYIKELKNVISYKNSHKITTYDLLTCSALEYSLALMITIKNYV